MLNLTKIASITSCNRTHFCNCKQCFKIVKLSEAIQSKIVTFNRKSVGDNRFCRIPGITAGSPTMPISFVLT